MLRVLTPSFRKKVYETASWGVGSSAIGKLPKAGCTVVLPWFPRAHIFVHDVSFESWRKRRISLWYRYGKSAAMGSHLRQPLIRARQSMRISHIVSLNASVPTYLQEFHSSKFCLHMRNDDPGGHRF